MENKEYRYFQFPLCLVQNILKDTENGFQYIISYAVVNYGKKAVKDYGFDVIRQMMYDYYRNRDKMENDLRKKIDKYVKDGKINIDEDFYGFSGAGKFQNYDRGEVLQIWEKDKIFEQQAILHYQIYFAAKFLNVSIGSTDSTIKRYETLKRQIEEHARKYGNDPEPMLKTDLIWEWEKGKKLNKNENELLCALIAIRSIIGQKKFTATHKSVIRMRMIGAKSNVVLKDLINDKELKEVYDKYLKRKRFDKLMERLASKGFIQSKISYGRKIFVSTQYNMQELETAIIEKRKEKNFKQQEAEARQRIKEGTTPIPYLNQTIEFLKKQPEGTYYFEKQFSENNNDKIRYFIEATQHIIKQNILKDCKITISPNFQTYTKAPEPTIFD